jgi:hypothetical protein
MIRKPLDLPPAVARAFGRPSRRKKRETTHTVRPSKWLSNTYLVGGGVSIDAHLNLGDVNSLQTAAARNSRQRQQDEGYSHGHGRI